MLERGPFKIETKDGIIAVHGPVNFLPRGFYTTAEAKQYSDMLNLAWKAGYAEGSKDAEAR